MINESKFDTLRDQMVKYQIEGRGIKNKGVLNAMRTIPRHYFIPENMRQFAYEDGPLPIGSGQTISQPYIVALMTNLLGLTGQENVLEIGTGSGYQAAILSQLADTVHTIEYHETLALQAGKVINDLGIKNVHVHVCDGSNGWEEAMPYQAIMITAASPEPPKPILQQLDNGGRLVLPVGARRHQDLQLWKRENGQYSYESIIPVAFVPLLGEHGWDNEKWNASLYY